jgi:PUB domain
VESLLGQQKKARGGMNFFDRFKPGGGKKATSSAAAGGGEIKWGSLLGGGQNQGGFKGSGEALGGKAPGKVIAVQLNDVGPLGIKVEKRPGSSTAIVSNVVPDSQAFRAGLQRGDVLCFQGSNGEEEIGYDMFFELAKSNQRPLCFEVRRVQSKAAAAASSDDSKSADAYARKQAMIAAAEKRERAHKAKEKPMTKGGKTLTNNKEIKNVNDETISVPKTEAARQAALEAKNQEAKLAAQLGYNPYEANKVTAGQARTATMAATHGEIQKDGSSTNKSTTKTKTTTPATNSTHNNSTPAPGTVRPPVDPTSTTAAADDADSIVRVQPPAEFDRAFEAAVTSSADHAAVVSSFVILRKLIVNATTKGQQQQQSNDKNDNYAAADDEAEKFRKVRLSNPKIKAAIVDLEGALDIMMSVGFELAEMPDGESYLVYPASHVVGQDWLPAALDRLEQYEKS